MDNTALQSMIADLSSNVDGLETALAPFLNPAVAHKLPLLDKAKYFTLATYAIESLLFSALRLSGVDAKAHPIFKELSRVKEYFEKIKSAETTGEKRTIAIDKDAVNRVIRHGLSGNKRADEGRVQTQMKAITGAKRKVEDFQGIGTHTRFEGYAKRARANEPFVSVVRATDADDDDDDDDDDDKKCDERDAAGVGGGEELDRSSRSIVASLQPKLDKGAVKRQRRLERRLAEQSVDGVENAPSPAAQDGS